jgi:hypothetical protein
MNSVICNECNKQFVQKNQKEEFHKTTRTFFICPHCNEQYTVGYTNARIQSQFFRIRLLKKKIENAKKNGDAKQVTKVFGQLQKLNLNNINATQELYKEMEAIRSGESDNGIK